MIDRAAFFAAVRKSLFGGRLSASQVAGMEDMLDAWDRSGFTDLRWLADIFGGVYHEVGRRMVPVREGFASTDAGARKVVAKRSYGKPAGPYGLVYYGRGRIQNTWLANYQKLEKRFGYPFVKEPDRLLESKIDATVTVHGHAEGIWTGKKLSDYFTPTKADWINARRIVNGIDRAAEIAGYSKAFHAALVSANRPGEPPAPPPPVTPPVEPPPPQDDPGPVTKPLTLWQALKGLGGSNSLT